MTFAVQRMVRMCAIHIAIDTVISRQVAMVAFRTLQCSAVLVRFLLKMEEVGHRVGMRIATTPAKSAAHSLAVK